MAARRLRSATWAIRRPIVSPPSPGGPYTRLGESATASTFLVVGATGFEPATFRPPAECATRLRHAPWLWRHRSASERATGLEPALRAWKALVRPLHHARGCGPF